MKNLTKNISVFVLLTLVFTLTSTQIGLAQEAVSCESDVVVQADDWLSKIAEKAFGDVLAYQAIADATNDKAATDDSYTAIDDVNVIEPGWKLCIPSAEEAVATIEESGLDEVEAVEGASITFAIPTDPQSFNGGVTGDYSKMIMAMTMLSLSDIDAHGNVFPELAIGLPTLENGGVVFDEEEWTMSATWTLRDDIFWADGEPITVDDVIFSWDAMTDPETGFWFPAVDYTDSIEKVDEKTLIIHYTTVFPSYLIHFGGEDIVIWPEHYCDADQGFVAWDCSYEPLSSGPYMLEEWVVGDHMTLVANPRYHEAGKPYIDEVVILVVPEESVAKTMMLEGDVDVDMWVSEVTAQEFEETESVGVSYSPTTRWAMRLLLNQSAKGSIDSVAEPHPFLSDVRVRQAIRKGIDVNTIVDTIFLGFSEPVSSELFRTPYDCGIAPAEYDPEGAMALLEEAGWVDTNGDGKRECQGCKNAEEGAPLAMEFTIYAEYGEALELAQQLMAETLGDIGFEVELSTVEGALMWADYESGGLEQNGKFEVNIWDDGYFGNDPTDFLWTYYHTDAQEPDYGWNVVRWSNEEFDALLDEAYSLDEEYRKELFCQMAEILDEEVPHILLWTAFDATAHTTRVQGVQASINDLVTWNIADWKVVE